MSGSANSTSVAVFGLGYVGAVSAACLARDGHMVIGVDPNPLKVAMINEGRSPVVEPGLTGLVADMVAAGRLRATDDFRQAVAGSDVALICVGTPSRDTGDTDLSHLRAVARQIGDALSDRTTPYTVCVRSTSFPGTTEDEVIPAIEEGAGRPVGTDIGVCFNPEFLREGSALLDYTTPPRVVVGGSDHKAREVVAGLYRHLDAPEVLTDLRSAEMLKYLDNAWHALKVGFANEVGRLAKRLGMDSGPLMEAFTLDTKLNISDKYLRPGFAFGGSCLPKD
ncbi:MAG TPA: nucleotide sugar dehydrogenase, partial [Acidimicrobiia bacterium]|nr:nucleotide sugar dehydrogenase [Acidimicrobiia bacterium]